MAIDTSTDPRRLEWVINDDVVRFRQWASDRAFYFPAPQGGDGSNWLIGTVEGCAVRLEDPRISRHHARLLRDQDRWSLLDLASKNGTRVDGVRQHTARLEPGMEIGIGGITLIAESARSIDLRCFLSRILGWSAERYEAVDLALREIRLAQVRRHPLVLRGEGDLVPVAADLHHHVFGASAPFVVCDPHRRSGASVRAPWNVEDGRAALVAAAGGTLCFRNERPPRDLPELLHQMQATTGARVQLLVCDDGSREAALPAELLAGMPIEIPSLSTRGADQVAHIVFEYASDAVQQLRAAKAMTPEDRAWVIANATTSLEEIAKATRRIVALRREGSLSGAAALLGMAPVSLRRWFRRRKSLPEDLRADDAAEIAAESPELDA
ncbi:MAG: FHA domain-containing protein [Kofleriaceae bacterium]